MEERDVDLLIPLYAVDIGRPLAGVKRFLDEHIDRYMPEMAGFLVSYSNIRLRQKHFIAHPDIPHIPTKVVVTACVFAPRLSALLTVTVTAIKAESVLCLAYDHYNVTVKRDSATAPEMVNFEYEVGQRLDVLITDIYSDHGHLSLTADPLAVIKVKDSPPRKRRRSSVKQEVTLHG